MAFFLRLQQTKASTRADGHETRKGKGKKGEGKDAAAPQSRQREALQTREGIRRREREGKRRGKEKEEKKGRKRREGKKKGKEKRTQRLHRRGPPEPSRSDTENRAEAPCKPACAQRWWRHSTGSTHPSGPREGGRVRGGRQDEEEPADPGGKSTQQAASPTQAAPQGPDSTRPVAD